MSGEVPYFSRFLVKFVEIIAAGFASAISAYLLAHFGGVLLSYPTPASAPVTPTASLLADSVRAQPIPLLAVAPVNERRAVPQKDIDAPAVQPAANAGKEAKTLPLRKHAKTATSVAEKGPRPAIGTNLQPRSPNVRATVDPQPSGAAPQPSPVDQDKDVLSALKRIPDLLRPEPPMPIGEAPRPPMPVVTASPEREFGN